MVKSQSEDAPAPPAPGAVPVSAGSLRQFSIRTPDGREIGTVECGSEREAREQARRIAREAGDPAAEGVLHVFGPTQQGSQYEQVTFVRATDDLRPLPRTREECIAAAGAVLAHAYYVADLWPVEAAARMAYTPTGPSIEELEARIAARRGIPWPPGPDQGSLE